MNRSSGIHRFHDGWRIAAASVVLFSHAWALGLIGSDTEFLGRLAHLAVIIFFVISGHAVASSFDRHRDFGKFLAARLSRVYAIVIPTLFFTLILDLIIGVKNVGYPAWQYPQWWVHIGLNLGFIGESWHLHHRPFSIVPYWSLAYEYWYYLFIASFAIKNSKLSLLLKAVTLLIAGPKILLLLPCWLLGVWVYRSTKRAIHVPPKVQISYITGTVVFLAFLALYLQSGLDALLQEYSKSICDQQLLNKLSAECGYSKWFIADYPIAIVFALVSAIVVAPKNSANPWVKKIAPHTFGIYLLHYPLLLAISTVLPKPHSILFGIVTISLVFALTILFSNVFDKSRPWLVKIFEKLFGVTKQRLQKITD
jgi:peptidoglycan/LPS O-acetylase OafA/YrhL